MILSRKEEAGDQIRNVLHKELEVVASVLELPPLYQTPSCNTRSAGPWPKAYSKQRGDTHPPNLPIKQLPQQLSRHGDAMLFGSRQPADKSTHADLSLRTSGQGVSLGDSAVIGNSLRLLSAVSGFWYFGDGCLVESSSTGGGRSIVKVRKPRCATSLPHSASSSERYMIMHGARLCGLFTQRRRNASVNSMW